MDAPAVSGIYRIRNTVNGKVYIGSAVNIRRRFRDHLRELHAGTHCNPRLQKSWAKHGEQAFCFEVVQIVEQKELLTSIETEHIATGRLTDPCRGYNICSTGRSALGLKRSDETRQKMSRWQIGRKMSDEARRKMTLSRIGRKLKPDHVAKLRAKRQSPEARAKISEALRKRPPPSEETRRKLSESNKGKKRSEESRRLMAEKAKGNRSALGHRLSDEAKAAISESQRKLSNHQVAEIIEKRLSGRTFKSLVEEYGCSVSTIRTAIRNAKEGRYGYSLPDPGN
ncbi:NUMOD3 domain-containing DNA-binding protein [Azospirillum sp. TSO5]|uniref:NUMOD3 domain-containing DNA-binding protein n=1 Tax=Azospirillum sp. TSO5 TaxID=716760 RepID=UPI000D658FFF|nr:NUMOD3 domain-containing DNA-binding protein [Azospirillum sp. TSO5]